CIHKKRDPARSRPGGCMHYDDGRRIRLLGRNSDSPAQAPNTNTQVDGSGTPITLMSPSVMRALVSQARPASNAGSLVSENSPPEVAKSKIWKELLNAGSKALIKDTDKVPSACRLLPTKI